MMDILSGTLVVLQLFYKTRFQNKKWGGGEALPCTNDLQIPQAP